MTLLCYWILVILASCLMLAMIWWVGICPSNHFKNVEISLEKSFRLAVFPTSWSLHLIQKATLIAVRARSLVAGEQCILFQ